ncbi:PGF-CTERM sorting domain-containing protein [Haloparvum sp. PAK95]|uniref:PGF-CTERM sorting domain-containing protein n=1 Tax=Haloparvum sp. PAK95 TaxID=3418962 RepID=UPI003D2F3E38
MRGLTRFVIAILAASLLVAAGAGVAVAWSDEQPLTDGEFYWQGQTIVASNFSSADEAALYTESGSHVRNITLENGDLEIDTSELKGQYYVTTPDREQISFEVAIQTIGVSVSVTRSTEDPPYLTATVTVSTNRGGTPAIYIYGTDNLADRLVGENGNVINGSTVAVEGTNGEITIALDDLAGGEEAIRARDPESGTGGIDIFDIPQITHPPDSYDGIVGRGETVWQGETVAVNVTAHDRYGLEQLDGEHIMTKQAATDGRLYVNTTDVEPGIYRVLENKSGNEVTRFRVKQQTLEATVDVEEETIRVESDRKEYTATVRIANDSGNVTARAVPKSEGDWMTLNASESAVLQLNLSVLAPGEYTVHVTVDDAPVTATSSFTIAEPETATPTETETETPETTVTQSSTATESITATDTSPTETATATNAKTPGFGIEIALAALLASVAWWRRG